MRLLDIRFKNLNSLAGEWEIDLTHPAYASDGIFAITGPTGAGKTTILDAICLALYGQTPRLAKVNKSVNEIMSLQTGECFAEVTFETSSGRFRCYWGQHRARKKPEGDLQNPKHEISEAESGKILGSKLKNVAEEVETITGMNFDRFTRSMLLAQGGFAAFLDASPDKRAPILEQITGTEIYSQISIQVHKRWSEEKQTLNLLQAELSGMHLLTEDEENQLNIDLQLKITEEIQLSQELTKTKEAIEWIERLSRLEKELLSLNEQNGTLQEKKENFKPDQQRLTLAKKALELSGDYASLRSLRHEQQSDLQKQKFFDQQLPEKKKNIEITQKKFNLAQESLKNVKNSQQSLFATLKEVREIDLKLIEKNIPITKSEDLIQDVSQKHEQTRVLNNENDHLISSKSDALEQIIHQHLENRNDEGLVEHLSSIRNRFEALEDQSKKKDYFSKQLSSAKTEKIQALETWNVSIALLEKQQKDLSHFQSDFKQTEKTLNQTLDQRPSLDWRSDLHKLKEKVSALQKQNLLNSRHEMLTKQLDPLTEQILRLNEKQTSLEKERDLLVTQLTLLKRIQDLEEARQHLQDGESCPLCGAIDHPFAEGNIPTPSTSEKSLEKINNEIKDSLKQLTDKQIVLARVTKELEEITTQQEELSKIIEGDSSDTVVKQHEETGKRIELIEELEKRLSIQRDALDKAKEYVTLTQRKTDTITHKKETLEQTVVRTTQDLKLATDQLEKIKNTLLQEISPYGLQTLSDKTLNALTARRNQWIARENKKTSIEKEIATRKTDKTHYQKQLTHFETTLSNEKNAYQTLTKQSAALKETRHKLFGNKSPDQEEKRATYLLLENEAALEETRKTFHTASQALVTLQASLTDMNQALQKRDSSLKVSEDNFVSTLQNSSFPNEPSYLNACLPEETRIQLQHRLQKLSDDQIELEAKLRETTTLYQTEKSKKITKNTIDPLIHERDEISHSLKSLLPQIIEINLQLSNNKNLRNKQQERVKAIEAQSKEFTRWDTLHELIGSNDGKKYRLFAQGLTFEMMIWHANRQLQKMSDRYLLIRDSDQPLTLNVIDTYQAAEIRTTKNLSGGERFIVSLSLALGLSQMASKNVRVDSLFLDEGFGALDDEALDTALETLSGLQQEGKLIGVISHVQALKERIGTQIQVSSHTGGRSLITGPGCTTL